MHVFTVNNKKKLVMMLLVCIAFVLVFLVLKNHKEIGTLGKEEPKILETHRDDFSAEIEENVKEYFNHVPELKKAYLLITGDWFLSSQLSDFSQALTTEEFYVVPWDEAGIPKDMDYSVYSVNDSGNLEWSYSAYPPEESFVPYGFAGLTYELIEKSIDGTEYEDYIITYAQRIDSVLVWIRSEKEDFILAYPTRPDLVGLDAGGLYTLKELQGRLAAAYSN